MTSGHSFQMQKNTPSSQVHIRHSLGWTTSWATNQTLVNLRKLESYQVSFQQQHYESRYQLQGKKCKKHKHMETKQYFSK